MKLLAALFDACIRRFPSSILNPRSYAGFGQVRFFSNARSTRVGNQESWQGAVHLEDKLHCSRSGGVSAADGHAPTTASGAPAPRHGRIEPCLGQWAECLAWPTYLQDLDAGASVFSGCFRGALLKSIYVQLDIQVHRRISPRVFYVSASADGGNSYRLTS